MLDARCRIQDTGYKVQGPRYKVPDIKGVILKEPFSRAFVKQLDNLLEITVINFGVWILDYHLSSCPGTRSYG